MRYTFSSFVTSHQHWEYVFRKYQIISAGGQFSGHERSHTETLEEKSTKKRSAPNNVVHNSNHTQSTELSQDVYNQVYDVQALKIILDGGSFRSADNAAERQLVDMTAELSKKMVNTEPSELLGGRTTVRSNICFRQIAFPARPSGSFGGQF